MKPYEPYDPNKDPDVFDPEDENISDEMEGEGSRKADRRYRERLKSFIREGRVDAAARDAAEAVDGPEGPSLRAAEEEGKARAKVPPLQALKGIARAFIGGAKAAYREATETMKTTSGNTRRK